LRKYDSTKHQTSKIVFDKLFMKAILNRFERVITLSNYESRDISDLFKTEPSRLRALEVFSDEFQDHDLSEAITTSFPYQEYICYVGRLDYRKNLMSLIRACLVLNMPLVIAGQDQGMLSALKKYSESESFDKFHYVGKISKEEKLLLLKNSSLVVIPSFFEGVPATAIEARKLRKKVVMTINSYMEDSPCIRKVNPDTDSLINAIKESLDSNTCTDKIISNDEIFTKFIGIVTEIVNLKRG
jgi:glycosyltransferase involved in cell wall biosynthesis